MLLVLLINSPPFFLHFWRFLFSFNFLNLASKKMNHTQLLALNQFSQIIFIYIDSSPRVSMCIKTIHQSINTLSLFAGITYIRWFHLHTAFGLIFTAIFFFLFVKAHWFLMGGKSLSFKHHHNLMFWDSSTTHIIRTL